MEMTQQEVLTVAKPILFNTEMVRAILDDRKKVTRRLVKLPHLRVLDSPYHREHPEVPDNVLIDKLCVPPYQLGNYLYVRETWARVQGNSCIANISGTCPYGSCGNAVGPCFPEEYIYKATDFLPLGGKWKPSIHMPKEAARIFLRVKDVSVERLQESLFNTSCPIFELQSEGIDIGDDCRQCINNYGEPCCIDEYNNEDECGILDEVRSKFSELWDSTIKPKDCDKYGWNANPLVWVIKFEKVEVK